MKKVLVILPILVLAYVGYVQMTNVYDTKLHSDVYAFLIDEKIFWDDSDYTSSKMRIRSAGDRVYKVNVTYYGIKDDDSPNSAKRSYLIRQDRDGSLSLVKN